MEDVDGNETRRQPKRIRRERIDGAEAAANVGRSCQSVGIPNSLITNDRYGQSINTNR